MEKRIIKPCILVALKSTINGGILYNRIDLEKENTNGTETAKWKTTRVIDNKEEYERAVKARGKAVNEIRKVCHPTGLGLLCPLEKEAELTEAIANTKQIIQEFNNESNYSRINVYTTIWETHDNGEAAVRALSAEVMDLIEEMQRGIDKFKVEDIRTAANKARQIVGTLENEQSEMLNDAIKEARKAARTFVKRIEKEGEKAEVVLSEVRRNDLEKARAAFLDYSQDEEESTESLPIAQPQRFDIDVSTEDASTEV